MTARIRKPRAARATPVVPRAAAKLRAARAAPVKLRATRAALTDPGAGTKKRASRARRKPRIGITCYSHFGGSGVVATELGRELARRGFEVHFIAHRLPFRLRSFASNVFFHEVASANYPVFDQSPSNLALTTKMVEVVEHYSLDLLHVHYAMPFAASA